MIHNVIKVFSCKKHGSSPVKGFNSSGRCKDCRTEQSKKTRKNRKIKILFGEIQLNCKIHGLNPDLGFYKSSLCKNCKKEYEIIKQNKILSGEIICKCKIHGLNPINGFYKNGECKDCDKKNWMLNREKIKNGDLMPSCKIHTTNSVNDFDKRGDCKACKQKYRKIYYENNKLNIANNNKELNCKIHGNLPKNGFQPNGDCKDCKNNWYETNKVEVLLDKKNYINNPLNKIKRNNRISFKYKNDMNHKMRSLISSAIKASIKNNNGLKNNKSFTEFLNFIDISNHIQSIYEPWMNNRNTGKYIKFKWSDNNSSTWKWQLDHIIPHSLFKYKSMGDNSFKLCWLKENLRPLSAKQNFEDGVNRVRHKFIKPLNIDFDKITIEEFKLLIKKVLRLEIIYKLFN